MRSQDYNFDVSFSHNQTSILRNRSSAYTVHLGASIANYKVIPRLSFGLWTRVKRKTRFNSRNDRWKLSQLFSVVVFPGARTDDGTHTRSLIFIKPEVVRALLFGSVTRLSVWTPWVFPVLMAPRNSRSRQGHDDFIPTKVRNFCTESGRIFFNIDISEMFFQVKIDAIWRIRLICFLLVYPSVRILYFSK